MQLNGQAKGISEETRHKLRIKLNERQLNSIERLKEAYNQLHQSLRMVLANRVTNLSQKVDNASILTKWYHRRELKKAIKALEQFEIDHTEK